MFNSYLLEALPSVREPGKIIGPIADLMGQIYNMLFEVLHSNTSAGSLGLAIIIFTLIVKMLLFPLMVKQQKSSFIMQQMKPELDKIKEKYPCIKNTISKDVFFVTSQELEDMYPDLTITEVRSAA